MHADQAPAPGSQQACGQNPSQGFAKSNHDGQEVCSAEETSSLLRLETVLEYGSESALLRSAELQIVQMPAQQVYCDALSCCAC